MDVPDHWFPVNAPGTPLGRIQLASVLRIARIGEGMVCGFPDRIGIQSLRSHPIFLKIPLTVVIVLFGLRQRPEL
jgi:hypothetical protein